MTSDTAGVTFTCTASGPGGVSTRSVTVKRDATKPIVSLSGGGNYTVADTVTITCSATDALSGVATSSCDTLAGSKPAYDYALGDTTITATTTDQAGNTATDSATVTVVDTPASMQTLVSSFSTSPGVAGALNGKLDSIAQAPNGQAKAGKVGAFINQVNAQTGKALTEAQAATLIRLVKAQ